jgi:hypothetical protein
VTADRPAPSFVERLTGSWLVRHIREIVVSAVALFGAVVVILMAAGRSLGEGEWVLAVLMAGGFVAAGLAFIETPIDRLKARDARSRTSIDNRINEASDALRATAGLVDELQAEMQTRIATLESLRAENDQYEQLAAVNKGQAEAVSHLIEAVMDTAHTRLKRATRRDQLMFFALGIVATEFVRLVVTWLG